MNRQYVPFFNEICLDKYPIPWCINCKDILRHTYLVTGYQKSVQSFKELPELVQERLGILLKQLALHGPVAHNWPNYSKLGKNRYHCHLKYSYVACWICEDDSIQIEVYYVGSRQSAPY